MSPSQQGSKQTQVSIPTINGTTLTRLEDKTAKLADHSRADPTSSGTDSPRQLTSRNDREPRRVNLHKGTRGEHAITTGKNRASERSPIIESRSSATTPNGGQSVPHTARGKPHRTKTSVLPFINGILCCSGRGAFAMDERDSALIGGPSITQRSALNSSSDETLHSQPIHHGKRAFSTPTPYGEHDSQQSADTKLAVNSSAEQREIRRLLRELSISRSRITELQQHREMHSRDQVASNGFLEIADTSSDTDVIRAVQKLNAELQQNATYMADCILQDLEFKTTATDAEKEYISLVEKVSGHIGPVLAKFLGSRPQELPLLLQIAFQAYLTATFGQIASAWDSDPGHSSFIDDIYQTLRGAEAQATSGRWRSLARLYNLRNWANRPEALVDRLITGLSDILLVAGCFAPRSRIISEITSKFKEKIALLVNLALRLNKNFGDVISSDFEVLFVRPGNKFEGDSMEETDGSGAAVREGSAVLCATHLGLTKNAPIGSVWEKGRREKMIVLKAKVSLESFFDAEDW